MAIFNYTISGIQGVVDTSRPLSGGIAHASLETLLASLVQYSAPTFVTANVATTANVSLVPGLNVIRTTSDGTIAAANVNLPLVSVNPLSGAASSTLGDGTKVTISTTGTITSVAGTVAGARVVPAITTLVAGVPVQIAYNLASNTWFRTT